MKTTRFFGVILAVLLCVLFVGCNSQDKEESTTDQPEAVVDGGWKEVEDGTITEEHTAMFEKVQKTTMGVSYKPLKLVATQVVSGMNYKFLCETTTITATPIKAEKYVTIYCDLDGNCSIVDVEDAENQEENGTFGGWKEVADGTITEEHTAMFEKATESTLGVSYKPLKLVATQVVSGKNYKFLCEQTIVSREVIKVEKYVTIYCDLNGDCTITNVEDVSD